METKLRQMLRDRADALSPPPEVPGPVLRRARRRRLASGMAAGVVALAMTAGALVAAQALSRPARTTAVAPTPKVSTTRTPPAVAPSLFPAIWPEGTAQEVAAAQGDVDAGHDHWRLDPVSVAKHFAQSFMGWDPDQLAIPVEAPGSTDTNAVVDLWNVAVLKEAGFRLHRLDVQGRKAGYAVPLPAGAPYTTRVILDQLGRTGDGGIWSVTLVDSPLIDLRCLSARSDVVGEGTAIEVCGQVGWAPAGDHVNASLAPSGPITLELAPCNEWPSSDIAIASGGFDGTLEPAPTCSALSGVLAVRLVDSGGLTVALDARKLQLEVPPSPGPSASAAPPTATAPPPPPDAGGVFGAMLDAIRAGSAPGWTFALTPDRLDGDWNLDGNVDDGSGPGRLLVYLTARPGMLEAHPCADTEFSQGATCVEQQLADGDLLALRDILDQGGSKTIEAVLIHPDRSGVGAEAGNWIISGTPGASPGGALERVTRAAPLYTVDQLGLLVKAVDEKTRGCIQTGC
jgi:hypothetical protein